MKNMEEDRNLTLSTDYLGLKGVVERLDYTPGNLDINLFIKFRRFIEGSVKADYLVNQLRKLPWKKFRIRLTPLPPCLALKPQLRRYYPEGSKYKFRFDTGYIYHSPFLDEENFKPLRKCKECKKYGKQCEGIYLHVTTPREEAIKERYAGGGNPLKLNEVFSSYNNKKVLDVCSTYRFELSPYSSYIKKNNLELVFSTSNIPLGISLREQVEKLKIGDEVSVKISCLKETPFEDEEFDEIIVNYLYNKIYDLEGVFNEFKRLLGEGGKLVIISKKSGMAEENLEFEKPFWFNGGFKAIRQSRLKEAEEFMDSMGFNIMDTITRENGFWLMRVEE